MKVRVGFVSNSSSASFVMVGVDIEALGVDKDELALVLAETYLPVTEGDLYNVCHEIQKDESNPKFGRACEGRYFGIIIARWTDEQDTPDYTLGLDELDRYATEIEDLLSQLGYEAEAELIGGEEVC